MTYFLDQTTPEEYNLIWGEYDRLNRELDAQDLEAGTERFDPVRFKRTYNVFRINHFASRIFTLTDKLELPTGSILHLLDDVSYPEDHQDIPRVEENLFLQNESLHKWIYHVRAPQVEGPISFNDKFIYHPSGLPSVFMKFRSTHGSEYKFCNTLQDLPTKMESLIVINHNPVLRTRFLGQLQYFRKTQLLWTSVLNTAHELMFLNKQQYILVPWGEEVFARSEFLRSRDKLNQTTVSHPENWHYITMMHIANFMWDSATTSIFRQIPEEDLSKINLILQIRDKFVIYNLQDLTELNSKNRAYIKVLNQMNMLSLAGRVDETASDDAKTAFKEIFSKEEPLTPDTEEEDTPAAYVLNKDTTTNTTDDTILDEQKEESIIEKAAKILPTNKILPNVSPVKGVVSNVKAVTPSAPKRDPEPAKTKTTSVTKPKFATNSSKEINPVKVDTSTADWVKELDTEAEQFIDDVEFLTPAQKNRAKVLAKKYKTVTLEGRKLEDILTEDTDLSIDDNVLTNEILGIDLPDQSGLKSSLQAYDQAYMKKTNLKHLVGVITSFQKNGVFLTGAKSKKVVTELNSYTDYSLQYEDIAGKKSVVKFRIPTVNRDGRVKIDGIQKVLKKQRITLPIVKINDLEVSLSSNYNKTRVMRNVTKAHSYFGFVDGLINDSSKSTAHITFGTCILHEFPVSYEYACLAERYKQVDFKTADGNEISLFFDYPKRLEHFQAAYGDEDKLQVLEKNYGTYCGHDKNVWLFVNNFNEVTAVKNTGGEVPDNPYPTLWDVLKLSLKEGVKPKQLTEYVTIKILDKQLPVIFMLAYRYGLRNTLDYLGVDYTVTEGRTKTIVAESAAGTEDFSIPSMEALAEEETTFNLVNRDDDSDIARLKNIVSSFKMTKRSLAMIKSPTKFFETPTGSYLDAALAVSYLCFRQKIVSTFVFIQTDREDYACVLARANDSWYWLDSSWDTHQGVHGPYRTQEDAIENVTQSWIDEYRNILTSRVVDRDVVRPFWEQETPTQEFLEAIGDKRHFLYDKDIKKLSIDEGYIREVEYTDGSRVKITSQEYKKQLHEGKVVNIVKYPTPADTVEIHDYPSAAGNESFKVIGLEDITEERKYTPKPGDIAIRFLDKTLWFNRYPLKNSLIVSGLDSYDLTSYEMSEFESKDIYYQLLLDKGMSINYLKGIDSFYDLFVDNMTYSILRSMHEPTNVRDLLIRASEMLTTLDYRVPSSRVNHRIRGYEQFNAVLYNEMSRQFAAYQSKRGRANKFSINPDAVYLRITQNASMVPSESPNPLQDIKEQSYMTYAGIGGRTSESFVVNDRRYAKDDVGVISEATVDNNKVGINAQLSLDPAITNTEGMLGETVDPQPANILSVYSLVFPFAAQDDSKRMNFISIQSSHWTPTVQTDPNRVRTGYERVVAHRCSKIFAGISEQDGSVTNIDEKTKLVTVEYKDGSRAVFPYGERYVPFQGFFATHHLEHVVKVGQKLKKGDVVTYNKGFFNRDKRSGQLDMSTGVMANVALLEMDVNLEDALLISQRLAEKLSIEPTNTRSVILKKNSMVYKCVKVGDHVGTLDHLMIFEEDPGLGDTLFDNVSEETQNLLGELNRRIPEAKYGGEIVKIEAHYGCPISEMHESLASVVRSAIAEQNRAARLTAGTEDEEDYPPNEVLSDGLKYNGVQYDPNTVVLTFYIRETETSKVGDKVVLSNQLKATISSVSQRPIYSEDGTELDVLFSNDSVSRRITLSQNFMGVLNRILPKMEQDVIDMYFNDK